MSEGWLRHHARRSGLKAEVLSAGTERTQVKPEAIAVMGEVGIDISHHTSKTLFELPDPWNFDLVLTVCDSANESCPSYPDRTTRLHVSVPDPSGHDLDGWRRVRDRLGVMSERLVAVLARGDTPSEADIAPDASVASVDGHR